MLRVGPLVIEEYVYDVFHTKSVHLTGCTRMYDISLLFGQACAVALTNCIHENQCFLHGVYHAVVVV